MIRDFLLALGFFTRIPVPAHPNFDQNTMTNTSYYFPIIGLIAGSVSLFVYWVSHQVFSVPVSVVLSLGAGLMLTGGFHEDGWADTFDGLGGAFDPSKKLSIMTDSRLGTYGSLALYFILTIKVLALIELLTVNTLLVFIVAHGVSRWMALLAMVFGDYVRVEPSKAKPMAKKISPFKWLLSGVVLVPSLIFLPWPILVVLFLVSLFICCLWIYILKKQLGGYTGDTLGAIQQSVEIGIYLSWLACI